MSVHIKKSRFARYLSVLLCGFTLLLTTAQAQVPSPLWSRSVYGSDDVGASPGAANKPVAVDPIGNVYVAGQTGDGTRIQFLTIKYDASGAMKWRAILPINEHAKASAIAVDAAGNSYVTGILTNTSEGDFYNDVITVKYNTDGAEQWRAVFSAFYRSRDAPISIVTGEDGSAYVIAGSETEYIRRAIVVKYAANGEKLWHRIVEGSASSYGAAFSAIVIDSSGNAHLTGSKVAPQGSMLEMFTISFAPDGTELKRQTYANPPQPLFGPYAIAPDSDGNVFVLGCAHLGNITATKLFKYNPAGTIIWQQYETYTNPIAGTFSCNGANITTDSMGNAVVAAQLPNGTGSSEFRTIKYSRDGDVIWSAALVTAGTSGYGRRTLLVDSQDNVLVGASVTAGTKAVYHIVKYSPDGSEQWHAQTDADPGVPVVNDAMIVDTNGNVITSVRVAVAQNSDLQTTKFSSSGTELWRAKEGIAVRLYTRFKDGRAMVVDTAGNTFIGGEVFPGRPLLLKYNANGTELWRNVGNPTLAISQLALDPAGSLIGGGRLTYLNDTFSAISKTEFAIIKVDANTGDETWRNTVIAADGTFNELLGFKLDAAGNIYAFGRSARAGGTGELFLLKINPSGAELWRRVISNATTSFANLAVDASGNTFLVGTTSINGRTAIAIAKYDASGIEQWRSALGDPALTGLSGAGVSVDGNGNIIVTGSNVLDAVKKQFVLAKFSPSGVESWRRIGLPASTFAIQLDEAISFSIDSAGNIVVADAFDYYPAGVPAEHGFLITKYTPQGDEQWRVRADAPGAFNSQLGTLQIDSLNNIFFMGLSSNSSVGQAGALLLKFTATGSEQFRIRLDDNRSLALALDQNRNLIIGGQLVDAQGVTTLNVSKYSQLAQPPGITRAIPGNGQATIEFQAPASSGAAPITSFTVTCGTVSATGTTSPITVTGLVNETEYACSVVANNTIGNSAASANVTVTPSVSAPLVLVSIVSRKTHGTSGTFDLPVDRAPTAGAVTVEPRTAGSGHTIVFQFNHAIATPGMVTVAPGGSVVATSSGSDVVVTLTNIADNRRSTISLANVNGVGLNTSATLGFLVGDVNNSRSVNASDIAGVKAHSGQPTNSSNYNFDINATGAINASDITAVKGRSGFSLPP